MPAIARSGWSWKSLSGSAPWSTAASDDLRAAAHAFALLDVATALAKLAVDDNYVRPEVDASLGFAIEGGRHPVVEQALEARRPALHRQRLRSLTRDRDKPRAKSG